MDESTAKKLIGTIYDRLFDIVTYRPTTSVNPIPYDPLSRNSTMLHLTKDMVISEADFGNARSPGNVAGLLNQSEIFSAFVDDIPKISTDYAPSGTKISSMYDTIVHGANSMEEPDPAQMVRYQQAVDYLNDTITDVDLDGNEVSYPVPSPRYKRYLDNRDAYMSAVTTYRQTQTNYDLTRPDEQNRWLAIEPSLKTKVDRAYSEWRGGNAAQIENAIQVQNTSINSAVRYAFQKARDVYDNARLGSLVQGGGDWRLSYAIPSDWANATGAINYGDFTLSSSNLNTTFSSTFESWGGGASFGFGFWSIGVDASGSTTTVHTHMDADNFSLRAKVGNIMIVRPWFDAGLFRLNDWYVDGFDPGTISNGHLTDNSNGRLPLVPVSMIVARDIEITANFSASDYDYMRTQWEAGASIGWGPFSFGGRYSHSETQERFHAEQSGGTLKIPGLHVLGWVSSVMPYSPPAAGA